MLEIDKIKKLCDAAESSEKLFWKVLKGQRSTTQMNAFLIDGKLITDKMIFVTFGQITSKTQVKLQLAFPLIMTFPTEFPLLSEICLYHVKTNCPLP